MLSCRDRGCRGGRAGAWCLSSLHHDSVRCGACLPRLCTPNEEKHQPPPIHPAPCPYRTLGHSHSPICSSQFIKVFLWVMIFSDKKQRLPASIAVSHHPMAVLALMFFLPSVPG